MHCEGKLKLRLRNTSYCEFCNKKKFKVKEWSEYKIQQQN
jgi:hypothetical protein